MEGLYERMRDNPMVWGMYYFPHHFRLPSPSFHLKVVLEAEKSRYLAIQAPRESAKSSIISFVKVAHSVCFKRKRFVVIVQNTYKKAAGSLETIKKEIRENERLRKDFKVELRKDAEGDTVFRHGDGFETRVLCKGSEQMGGIRGEKFGAYRPDLIIGDDMEDDEMVKNPERRMDFKDVFDSALIPAGDAGVCQYIFIGTILHDDCLMAKLVSKDYYTEYRKLFYVARYVKDGVKKSLWHEKWSVEDLDRMERERPEIFAKEYQGDPSSGSLETIRREDFRYWKEEEGYVVLFNTDMTVKKRWKVSDCKAAIALDMAWEEKQVNDFTAIVPGLCTPENDILVDDYISERGMRPDKLEEIIFTMSDKYEKMTGKRVQIGMEKAKLEKVMNWFLSEAQRRRNQWLWMKMISWGTKDKIERILARLGNRYSQHSVYHKKGMGDLENQLIRLRSVAHDDIADAAGMLPEMLAFAPSTIKDIKSDDKFSWWSKQTPLYRERSKSKYIFGSKQKGSVIKTVKASI